MSSGEKVQGSLQGGGAEGQRELTFLEEPSFQGLVYRSNDRTHRNGVWGTVCSSYGTAHSILRTTPRELGRSEVLGRQAREPERLGDFPEVTQLGSCCGSVRTSGASTDRLRGFSGGPLGQSTREKRKQGLRGQMAFLWSDLRASATVADTVPSQGPGETTYQNA